MYSIKEFRLCEKYRILILVGQLRTLFTYQASSTNTQHWYTALIHKIVEILGTCSRRFFHVCLMEGHTKSNLTLIDFYSGTLHWPQYFLTPIFLSATATATYPCASIFSLNPLTQWTFESLDSWLKQCSEPEEMAISCPARFSCDQRQPLGEYWMEKETKLDQ